MKSVFLSPANEVARTFGPFILVIALLSRAVALGAEGNMGIPSQASARRPASTESENPKIQHMVTEHMGALRMADKLKQEQAVSSLRTGLMLACNANGKLPKMETSKALSESLVAYYNAESNNQSFSSSARRDVIQTITLYGDDVVAKKFVLRILEKGAKEEREAALAVVGMLAVTGDDVYAMIEQLVKRKLIPLRDRTTVLARVNKEKALPEILKDVAASKDREIFLYSAWALLEYYRRPEDYGRILPRIKELRLGEPNSFKNTDGLFWMKADLFAAYLDQVRGEELISALAFMEAFDAVRRPTSAPAVQRKLGDGSPQARASAARILAKLSEYSKADRTSIKESLRHAESAETDQQVKKTIQGALASIEQFERSWQQELQRRK